MGCYQKAWHVNVRCFCLYLLRLWLDIVFLRTLEGKHLLRLERAVSRDLHDLSAMMSRVNLPILTSIDVTHVNVSDELSLPLAAVSSEACLYISFAKGCRNVFLRYHSTMYFIFRRICKSNCGVTHYFVERLPAIFFGFATLKTSTDPDIYTSWFLASSLQDSDNTISVFFAVEKQTGLWTDHYINSFLKGGSYFKKGWRNAKRDLNFNLNLFQQVKGSFERGFQQRWWYLKVINKHLNLQWKTVILLLSSVGEELGFAMVTSKK